MSMEHVHPPEPLCSACCDGWVPPLPCPSCGQAGLSSQHIEHIRERLNNSAVLDVGWRAVEEDPDMDEWEVRDHGVGAYRVFASRLTHARADFIAHAPEDIEALLAEVKCLSAANAALVEQVAHHHERGAELVDDLKSAQERADALCRERDTYRAFAVRVATMAATPGCEDYAVTIGPDDLEHLAETVSAVTAELRAKVKSLREDLDAMRSQSIRVQHQRDQARAEVRRLSEAVETIAEKLREDLWVGDNDERGHAYYERLVDALGGAEPTPAEVTATALLQAAAEMPSQGPDHLAACAAAYREALAQAGDIGAGGEVDASA